MARRAPLKATGEPRALTFNTSELLQTGRASPGGAWKRSGRRLTGTFGRPGGKLLSEHIEVESGKNTTGNSYSPVIWLGWLEIRFGSAFGKPRSVGEPPRTPRGSAGQGRPQLPSHYRHRQGWPARPKASRLHPPPWVLLSPEAIRADRARRLGSRWP